MVESRNYCEKNVKQEASKKEEARIVRNDQRRL